MMRLFAAKKGRLLLLDDDPSMQRLMSTLLRRAGYRVDIVSQASDAMREIAKNDYDGLLLDIMTPTEGGMTVIRDLKEVQPELLQRILLVTGSPDFVLRSVIGDVHGVLRKPFDATSLLEAVAKLVK
jgi:DNA-binding NtrC family response regulator